MLVDTASGNGVERVRERLVAMLAAARRARADADAPAFDEAPGRP
jgi:hypothetical protein